MEGILVLWERCNACGDCLTACTAEMARLGEPLPHIPRLTIRGQEQPTYVALCRHCAEAPCRDACISGAITMADEGRLELADETGTTSIVQEIQGGLLIGILSQYRYWTPSRARMLGAVIVRQHMSVFEE